MVGGCGKHGVSLTGHDSITSKSPTPMLSRSEGRFERNLAAIAGPISMASTDALGQGDPSWPGPFRTDLHDLRLRRQHLEQRVKQVGGIRGPHLVVDLCGFVERKSDVVWSHHFGFARGLRTCSICRSGSGISGDLGYPKC